MTDIDKLIEELRNLAALAPSQKYRVAFTSAADTIAAQSKRIEELEKEKASIQIELLVEQLKDDVTREVVKAQNPEQFEKLRKTLNGGSDNG